MVTVDVLERFRTRSRTGKENAYAADYETIKELQSLAAELRIAILFVTHLRKGADEGDPIPGIIPLHAKSSDRDAVADNDKVRAPAIRSAPPHLQARTPPRRVLWTLAECPR